MGADVTLSGRLLDHILETKPPEKSLEEHLRDSTQLWVEIHNPEEMLTIDEEVGARA